jgi:hypothetical protein
VREVLSTGPEIFFPGPKAILATTIANGLLIPQDRLPYTNLAMLSVFSMSMKEVIKQPVVLGMRALSIAMGTTFSLAHTMRIQSWTTAAIEGDLS